MAGWTDGEERIPLKQWEDFKRGFKCAYRELGKLVPAIFKFWLWDWEAIGVMLGVFSAASMLALIAIIIARVAFK